MVKKHRKLASQAAISTPADRRAGNDHIKLLQNQFSVADLLNFYRNHELDLTPRFQRRPVWKSGAKSFFIDTVLRGLPVPPVILRDRPTDLRSLKPMREVVDGQQRLRTLFSFVKPDSVLNPNGSPDTFTLQRVHQPDFPNNNFDDLPPEYQRRILDYQIITHIFPIATEDRDILEVFARLNATGTALKPQELRNARFYGEFKTLCFSLATGHLTFWLDSGIFKDESIARMDEVELTSDLVLTIMRGVGEGSKSTIDRAYKDYDQELPNEKSIEGRFGQTILAIYHNFDFSKAKRFRNRSLFFCLFAAYYDVLYGLESHLTANKKPSQDVDAIHAINEAAHKISTGTAPEIVQTATERRLSHKSERTTVIKFLRRNRKHAE